MYAAGCSGTAQLLPIMFMGVQGRGAGPKKSIPPYVNPAELIIPRFTRYRKDLGYPLPPVVSHPPPLPRNFLSSPRGPRVKKGGGPCIANSPPAPRLQGTGGTQFAGAVTKFAARRSVPVRRLFQGTWKTQCFPRPLPCLYIDWTDISRRPCPRIQSWRHLLVPLLIREYRGGGPVQKIVASWFHPAEVIGLRFTR